jgi:hypothetical protein
VFDQRLVQRKNREGKEGLSCVSMNDRQAHGPQPENDIEVCSLLFCVIMSRTAGVSKKKNFFYKISVVSLQHLSEYFSS